MNRDEGAGLGRKEKGRGAGLDRTEKDVGAGRQEQGHGSGDTDTSNSYLPADPRLVEVHDVGTVVQHCSQVLGVVSGIQDGPVLTDPDNDVRTPESLL